MRALWVAAGLIGAIKIVTVVVTPFPWRVLAFNSDDVHYYVLTALNAATGHGSTFDGLTPTNGYQPLWFLALTGAFRVTGVDRPGAYVVTMVLLAVLWVLALVLLYRLGRDVLGTTGAVLGLTGFLIHARWWTGCENALVVVILLAIVLVIVRHPDLSTRTLVVLGVLLALLTLARLDAVVLTALLALWRWRDRRAVGLIVAPTAVTLGAYAAVNETVFGVPVPVSGLAKQLGAVGRNWSVLMDFLLYGSLGPLPLLFGATVLVAGTTALVLSGSPRRLPPPLRDRAPQVRTVIALLLLAQFGQLLYYAVMSSWELQGWYFSFGVVALVLSLGVIGARFSDLSWVRVGAIAVSAAVLVVVAAHEMVVVRATDPNASPAARDIDAGLWADAHLPAGSVLAMGDWAGTLAATTHHPVVQLEGLVGSPEYLRALQDGTAPAYLRRVGVTHYVRLTHPGEQVGCQVTEPYFGLGPRTTFDVCTRPVVYHGRVLDTVDLLIWEQ